MDMPIVPAVEYTNAQVTLEQEEMHRLFKKALRSMATNFGKPNIETDAIGTIQVDGETVKVRVHVAYGDWIGDNAHMALAEFDGPGNMIYFVSRVDNGGWTALQYYAEAPDGTEIVPTKTFKVQPMSVLRPIES